MKKLVLLLFLSFFVSLMNAATMPMDLSGVDATTVVSVHDHCQDASPNSDHENGKSSLNVNTGHYCCSAVAVLTTTPAFSSSKQLDVYLLSKISISKSNITESIYKPPRNYL